MSARRRGRRTSVAPTRTADPGGSHRPRPFVLYGLRGTHSGCEISLCPLATHTEPPRHPLPQTLCGAPHVSELESDGGAQSATGRQGARAPAHDDVFGLRGVGGGRSRERHRRNSRRNESAGPDRAEFDPSPTGDKATSPPWCPLEKPGARPPKKNSPPLSPTSRPSDLAVDLSVAEWHRATSH